ncbi:gas vesicle protein GvpG [Micromonospora sp. DSM 115977]|uniref:Gas vesicle protein GvpG n=1 Tax=Micromonospora reichwaldensis TaxID=3075516 RepID=A0ABU2WUL3_9ACTN|nr:gas vesicle protein GvpG [Micromonospora sp. DSM 115977]MDT0529621.1 gas vesicle protein GvpG [Micromonospora sp. DSM 115977]
MDILWTLLTLPYAPVRGLTAVVKVIAREAESRQRNPVDVRRELEALDAAAAAGEISAAERDRGQQQVLERLTGGVQRPEPAQGRAPARNGPGSRRQNGGPRHQSGADRARQSASGRARQSASGRARQAGTERAPQPGEGRARRTGTERARQVGTERSRRVSRGGGEGR